MSYEADCCFALSFFVVDDVDAGSGELWLWQWCTFVVDTVDSVNGCGP